MLFQNLPWRPKLTLVEQALPYRTPVIRDLAWTLGSPPLLRRRDHPVYWPDAGWFAQVYRDYRPALRALDEDPSPLLELLDTRRDRRLGSYFETLLRFWLEDCGRFRLLHANLPVREAGRTLGEFDFVAVDEHSGKTLHLEVAVKFYLGCDNTLDAANWWGPARRDRLDLKTTRMLAHQARLASQAAARAMFAAQGIRVDATWLVMKGRLFYPLAGDRTAPRDAAAGHLRGSWLHAGRLAELPQGDWCPLEKSQWLSPVTGSLDTLSRAQLVEWWHDNQPLRPHCIAAVSAAGETARVFVVPDEWGQEVPRL